MNWTNNQAFIGIAHRLDGIINTAASLGHIDGVALRNRRRGHNNLQGHANALEKLAILIAKETPGILPAIRARTNVLSNMGPGTPESRDDTIKQLIASAIHTLLTNNGTDIIAHELKSSDPITVQSACNTYLSAGIGGGQARGGSGDTVVKRTLKLLAHFSG